MKDAAFSVEAAEDGAFETAALLLREAPVLLLFPRVRCTAQPLEARRPSRTPQALHRVLGPRGPFRQSGVVVVPQHAHTRPGTGVKLGSSEDVSGAEGIDNSGTVIPSLAYSLAHNSGSKKVLFAGRSPWKEITRHVKDSTCQTRELIETPPW